MSSQKISLKLTIEELNIIIAGLQNIPFGSAAPVIQKIQNSVTEQNEEDKEDKEES